jgi:hypothetical protein
MPLTAKQETFAQLVFQGLIPPKQYPAIGTET